MMLFNIGAGTEVRAGDVRGRGYYLGSNASYNLKKMREGGYLERRAHDGDHRVVKLALTPKGEEVAEVVDELFQRQLHAVGEVNSDLTPENLATLISQMGQLERFWALRARIDLNQRTAA
jgi:DNA-binding MarR family transcriptional regulator